MMKMATDFVFVFGSNLAGRHGAGAAKYAVQYYDAKYGVGEGPTGRSYALPTKDENLNTRSYEEISVSIIHFMNYAKKNSNQIFVLTPVGCGLAGLEASKIANLFKMHTAGKMPSNVVLHTSWLDHF